MEDALAVRRVDRLGVVLVAGGALAMAWAPFIIVKANRIAAGKPQLLTQLIAQPAAVVLLILLTAAALAALFLRNQIIRLGIATLAIAALILTLGFVSTAATPAGSTVARITPGGSFWVLLAVVGLMISDALVKLRLTPWLRVAALALYAALLTVVLRSGLLDNLSIMKEYANNADKFWHEALSHVFLSIGSVAIAIVLALPLGIFCYWQPRIRAVVLRALSLVQTIPSLALFGILMLPLGYIAANVPFAAEIGVKGIGVAPALVALVIYSLLPIVANTVVGLAGVDPSVRDSAAGMGLTRRQILTGIDLPLAFPVILTGIRIVLVQAIGLVTVAALIGGGGFGLFIFQGIGQTANDLVLLGAVPTVFLAFSSAVILDAVIDSIRGQRA
ncbi:MULTISPECIES: ABC transporter permease [unclassified Rhizobium]|uniref:ABC transporter permease n=1 Tax=unclassified Rhizobium TaxID=2613769 RepID=UPI0016183D49|nr:MULTISPECIES: ABC transporter permease [unclassified Rhizobium]MBB3287509.1 osmoprotectant transport system permease protein [Rhizobium sp. BK252]MBB3402249.1 osmoprotectant transport system permease protein [Rhizobium sp. BK289]MBB3414826.1 osmoprotectant transport system permease protein [Rhizobium sp. BK284]MBB3482715.1 osmoprotectant transport system permease protein [Rhizobium sp. BK347]MDK4721790.1 ABC transporter permease [Rhizobium sp. CNPSo 3968]